MPLILLVDDEPAIRESLGFALGREGFEVRAAGSLRDAAAQVARADLLVLDLMLPDGSGLEFLRTLRARSDVPVIVLTSRDDEADRLEGLEAGADDYVVKPFSPREVAARARAVLRRARKVAPEAAPRAEAPLQAGELQLDPRTRRARAIGRELPLSRTEFDLLAAFLRAPGVVFDRSKLMETVWGPDCVVGDRTIDVHLKALRRKIKEAGGDPLVLETVRGVGYRLREEGRPPAPDAGPS
jgi:two-component system catabolic regulation response regulator CreB